MSSQYNTPYNGPEGPVSLSERQRICAAAVGTVEWAEGGEWGYCACPGAQFHHNKTARRDCRVFAIETRRQGRIDPPGVYCLHTSCSGSVAETSHRIRVEIGRAKVAAARALPPAPSGTPRNVRSASKTVRTFEFRVREKEEAVTPVKTPSDTTVRTDENRPLTRFAHVRAYAPACAEPAKQPSEPSLPTPVGKQPPPQPAPKKEQPATQPQAEKPGIVTMIDAAGRAHRLGPDGEVKFTFQTKHEST